MRSHELTWFAAVASEGFDELAVTRVPHEPIAVLRRFRGTRPMPIGNQDVAVRCGPAGRRLEKCVLARLRHARLAQGQKKLSIGTVFEHLISPNPGVGT